MGEGGWSLLIFNIPLITSVSIRRPSSWSFFPAKIHSVATRSTLFILFFFFSNMHSQVYSGRNQVKCSNSINSFFLF